MLKRGRRENAAKRAKKAQDLTQEALGHTEHDPERFVRAADAHWSAADAHAVAGLPDQARHHEGQARMLGYASRNPGVFSGNPEKDKPKKAGGESRTAAATRAAAAHFDPSRHPHGAGGKWLSTGKGTQSHEGKYTG